MDPTLQTAAEVEAACRASGVPFCFTGRMAVQRWGEVRDDAEIEVTVFTGFGGEARFVDALLAAFSARIADARAFALRHRTLPLCAKNQTPINISLGAMPFEEHAVTRATPFEIGGVTVTTCSAEDLIVQKAFAGRDEDWLDIRSVAARQADKLDLATLWDELLPLLELKSDAATEARLRKILA